MRDHNTPTRHAFLKRIQQRIDTDLIIAGVCGVILGALFAAFI